ncbi:MAG: TraR/DksA C4-type zinc finger protein [Candidatus Omnitrophica bacterium]|nr:TraR/DksA C4-type zinc finger protein [Candidatus Omnitrophota bacterium]
MGAIDRKKDPREEIKGLLAKGELEKLLGKAGEIHGHYCSHVALGVMATYIAFRKLGITDSTGMEEILAIVECNNCFVDGIQAVSGCTLGNNALIYKDLGKTAVTFIDRKTNKAVRLAAKYSGRDEPKDAEDREARELFDRAVKRREKLEPRQAERMKELWTKMSFSVLSQPEDDLFHVKFVEPETIAYAPIFDSVQCSSCGENAMETRARMKEGKAVCVKCAGDDYWMVAGRGIHPVGKR